MVILPYENESAKGIDEVISGLDSVKSVAVIIGPEGGFAEEEVACLSENGANSVKLVPVYCVQNSGCCECCTGSVCPGRPRKTFKLNEET